MASDVVFELGRPKDDLAIRELLTRTPTAGRVSLSVEYSPSYFVGCQTMGSLHVLVGRHKPTGEIIALGCRGSRERFVNGIVQEVPYLTHLRVDERFRGRATVSRAYRFTHDWNNNALVAGSITIIGEDNREALGLLVDRRRGYIPAYRLVSRLCSLALLVRRPFGRSRSIYEISRGSDSMLGEIVEFLRRHGAARQFFPAYTEEDFRNGSPTTLGFRKEDFFIARRDGKIVGVMGLWDRSGSRQAVVRGYSGSLQWGKPIFNLAAPVLGARPLPDPGQPLSLAYVSFLAVAYNNRDVFAALLRDVYNVAGQRRYGYLVIDLPEQDPLLSVARRYIHSTYYRRLYTVSWDDGEFHSGLDGRLPYVDTAAL